MRNRKYYPFERNSYYYGKLLTARDFEAEQRYFNDKRRFVNRLSGANGIVSGLGVIMADDASVILQAGAALDASGREIVVDETRVVKLSTIEGYSQLTTSCAYLGISYDEQPTDEVYSVMSGEEGEGKFNKVKETYKLSLLDENLVAKIPYPLEEFVEEKVLYSDQELQVCQYTPRYLPLGSDLMIRTVMKRTAPGKGEYSLVYTLDTPGFQTPQGQQSFQVAANNVILLQGEEKTLEYRLHPEDYVRNGNSVSLTVSDLVIRRGEESFQLNQKLELPIKPVGQELTDFYLTTIYGKSMDKVLGDTYDERLWIAKIHLIRQNTSVIIDSVSPPPFAQYSYNPQQLMALRRLEEYYPEVVSGLVLPATPAAAAMQSVLTEQPEQSRNTACGVFTMPLGLGYDPREALYSEEIMHGLGKGPVYVDVGVEYITNDEQAGSSSEILLGDVSIFDQDGHAGDEDRIYHISTAVKVLPERGTFVVGMRISDTSGPISLRVRWFAMRLGEVGKQIKPKEEGKRMIMVNPDTIVLQPKASTHIAPVFLNMPSEACSYRLLDAEGGMIDQNGVYTAPAKEGVYEIRVEALSDPTVYTHVFAIVTQKKKD